jgi:hypothetical protein
MNIHSGCFYKLRQFRGALLVCGAACVSLLPWRAGAIDLTIDPATNNAAAVAELAGAIKTASTNGLTNAINLFVNGVYTLSQADNWEYGPNGLPQISGDITIIGRGATLQRATNSPAFRFFYVSGGLSYDPISGAGLPAGNLTLKNMTLLGGFARGGNGTGEAGGGAGLGGAIFNQGNLTMAGVTLAGNKAQGGNGGSNTSPGGGGGGMGEDGNGPIGGGFGGPFIGTGGHGGAGNLGGGGGGGGFGPNDNGLDAATNHAGAGGGLGRSGMWGLGDGGYGGSPWGIPHGGSAGGNFGFGGLGSGDSGSDCGGGGGIGGGGGHGGFSGTDGAGGFGGGGGGGGEDGGDGGFGGGGGGGNGGSAGGFAGGHGSATDDGGGGGSGLGGAIFNHRGTVALINCTLSANTAQGGDGGYADDGEPLYLPYTGMGGSGFGGGIFNLNGALSLTSCTVASNTTIPGTTPTWFYSNSGHVSTNDPTGSADGGAVYNLAYGNKIEDGSASIATVTLFNTILATSVGASNNLVNNEVNGSQTNIATVTFSAKNLVTSHVDLSGGTCLGAPTVTVDPKLGPLAKNGGPTPTMALLFGSPAIDQGLSNGLLTDERGSSRPVLLANSFVAAGGDGSDIGAFEFSAPVLAIAKVPSGIRLSWSTNYPGYVVAWQATSQPSGAWTHLAITPAIVGSEYVVTDSAIAGNKFYRLTNP